MASFTVNFPSPSKSSARKGTLLGSWGSEPFTVSKSSEKPSQSLSSGGRGVGIGVGENHRRRNGWRGGGSLDSEARSRWGLGSRSVQARQRPRYRTPATSPAGIVTFPGTRRSKVWLSTARRSTTARPGGRTREAPRQSGVRHRVSIIHLESPGGRRIRNGAGNRAPSWYAPPDPRSNCIRLRAAAAAHRRPGLHQSPLVAALSIPALNSTPGASKVTSHCTEAVPSASAILGSPVSAPALFTELEASPLANPLAASLSFCIPAVPESAGQGIVVL